MSYILDALRRAEADRARGVVPGLHANNMPADTEPAARNFNPLIWAGGVALALLVAVVAILLFAPWRSAPATQPGAIASAAPDSLQAQAQAAAPAPAPATAVTPAPQMPSFPAQPAQTSPPLGNLPPQLASRAAAGRVAALDPRPLAARDLAQGRANMATSAAPNSTAVAAPVEHYGAPAAPTAPVANFNDLPVDVRTQLPRLAVGGAIYSAAPADRMLILNGQVYHEGDKPAADTVLEQIHLKNAVLNYRGQRYQITY